MAELQKIHCNTNVIGTQQKSLLKRALESYQVTAEDLVPEQIMDVGLEDTKLDFVLSMAMDHFQKEIRNQSAMLNINTSKYPPPKKIKLTRLKMARKFKMEGNSSFCSNSLI